MSGIKREQVQWLNKPWLPVGVQRRAPSPFTRNSIECYENYHYQRENAEELRKGCPSEIDTGFGVNVNVAR